MSKVSSTRLNDLLFEQLERLQEAESDDDIKREVERSKAVAQVANQINSNTKNAIEAWEKGATNEQRIGFIE